MSQLSQDKDRIATLAALSVLFSVSENALPRLVPFLKLGLANIPLLYALPLLDFKSYLLLALLKWLLGNLMSGLLFSWLSIFSLLSTACAVLSMKLFYILLKERLSAYGYSLIGSVSSNTVQLALASLYLGVSLDALLPFILLFSALSAILTAALSYKITIPETFSVSIEAEDEETKGSRLFVFPLLALISVPFSRSIVLLSLSFILALLMRLASGKKIRIGYYLVTLLFMVLLSGFGGEGRILFLTFTKEALISGAAKGLSLITLVALSQTIAPLLPIHSGLLKKTLSISAMMLQSLGDKGSIKERIGRVFEADFSKLEKTPSVRKTNSALLILLSAAIILASALSFCHPVMNAVKF